VLTSSGDSQNVTTRSAGLEMIPGVVVPLLGLTLTVIDRCVLRGTVGLAAGATTYLG